jgi:purine nucleosidase
MKLYYNHDGGVDDLVSLFLLLQMDDVELVGVGVVPADSYLEPAISASLKIISKFGVRSSKNFKVSPSTARTSHPFPRDWRLAAFTIDALPVLNELEFDDGLLSNRAAHLDLVSVLQSSESLVTLLFTGPVTDLASALTVEPSIASKVDRLVWMGGSFSKGNVAEPGHDGTAEWNSFWDPEAAKAVWDSPIRIQLVTLDVTNQVPLTIADRMRWAKLRRFEGLDFIGQAYASCPPVVHFTTNSTYFLWDVLATILMNKPEFGNVKKVRSDVVVAGQSSGRAVLKEDGREVEMLEQVDRDAFFAYIEQLGKRAHFPVKYEPSDFVVAPTKLDPRKLP